MEKFSDLKTNLVYFSQFFALRFPGIFETARCNLESNGVKVRTIPDNFNIWARDYIPLQVGDHYIRFGYKGYGTGYDYYPWLQVPDASIESVIPKEKIIDSQIVIDGGGVVRSERHAIITEKVFLDNPGVSRETLIDQLSLLFGLDIVIIPMEPGDTLGHADGICKFVKNDTVLLNDYSVMASKEYDAFQNQVWNAFRAAGLYFVFMPFAYNLCFQMSASEYRKQYPYSDDQNSAYGYYVNFLLTKTCIIAPVFGIPKDIEAIETLKKCYPSHNVIAVDCAELSMEGGLMSCVTASYIL
jgi:agmatine deiminase